MKRFDPVLQSEFLLEIQRFMLSCVTRPVNWLIGDLKHTITVT